MSSKRKEANDDAALIGGRNPVREALGRSEVQIEKVLLQRGSSGRPIDEIRKAAGEAGVPVQFVPPAKLNQMAPGLNHQGVVAVASQVAYRDVDEVLRAIAPTRDDVQARKPLLLVLDRIVDPHNYGAILRSAVAAGAEAVFVPKDHMAPLSAAAMKASAGTAPRIPIARATNLTQLLMQLKERGYWVAGAAGDGDTTVWDMDWDRPLALVIGSEGKGLRPVVAGACDYQVAIPMRGPAESLNASVAAGILLFAAARCRS